MRLKLIIIYWIKLKNVLKEKGKICAFNEYSLSSDSVPSLRPLEALINIKNSLAFWISYFRVSNHNILDSTLNNMVS